jgi:hypothetical protein
MTRPVRRFFDLLDEFAALGHLAPIERAMTLMAGYGIQLWTILQDVHQLQATYGRARRHFLSNVAVLQVSGINDHQSGRLPSDLLGQRTVVFETTSQAMDSDRSGSFMRSIIRPAHCSPPTKSAICRKPANCCSSPGCGRCWPASSAIMWIGSSRDYLRGYNWLVG